MFRVLTLSTLFPDASRPTFGIFVERQTAALAAMPDTQVRVVAPVGLPPWPFSKLQAYAPRAALPMRETWQGLDVHRPRFTVIPRTGGRFHAAALTRSLGPLLTAFRREWRFDVIDASFFFPDGPAAVALGRRLGVPVSIKARGADIHHWGRSAATAAQVLAAGRAADGMLAVSGAMRGDMVALGMPADRIRVHHTGVDHARFRLADRAAAKQALGIAGPMVASVGALIPRKGHDVVMRAVATLPDVTLAIAGEGPARAALLRLAQQLGIADQVRLLGSVAPADLPRILAAADVMALASSSEGLANAWVEAMACGTPVVIPDTGGAREVVTLGSGRLADRSPDAFAAAIADLLGNPPDPATVRLATAGFTWEANAAALRAHLSSLVSG